MTEAVETVKELIGLGTEEFAEGDTTTSNFPTLSFRAEDFVAFVDGEVLTQQQAEQLLCAVWTIMVAFVDLAYGFPLAKPFVDQIPASLETSKHDSGPVVSSIPHTKTMRTKPAPKRGRERIHDHGV